MNALTIPVSAEMLTMEHVDAAWASYVARAEFYLLGSKLSPEGRQKQINVLFESNEEFEVAIARAVLEAIDGIDAINDVVRQRAVQVITAYEASFDSWEAIADQSGRLAGTLSKSGRSQHTTIATIVAPFCQRHDIPVSLEPGKFGALRESASGLRWIIGNPNLNTAEKVEQVEEAMEFISTCNHVRDARNYFSVNEPVGRGALTDHAGETAIVIFTSPAAARAIQQRLGDLIAWNLRGTDITHSQGEWRTSKHNPNESVRNNATTVTVQTMQVVNNEGEIKEIIL